jgi:hypothetical protein
MRILAIIMLLLGTGCASTSTLQCDEIYGDYNCPNPKGLSYWYSPSPYSSYYPNTQTVHYVPVYIPQSPPCPESTPERVISGPRPSGIVTHYKRKRQ